MNNTLGGRISELLQKRGIQQKEPAERIGVSETVVFLTLSKTAAEYLPISAFRFRRDTKMKPN